MTTLRKFQLRREYGILFSCALLWLVFCVLTIRYIHGFCILPDEYGYWAQAAKMAGYDWSMVSAQQRYYSFGYSFILMPVLRLFHSAQLRYRTVVILQFIGMAFSPFLLYGIWGKGEKKTKEEKKRAALICGMVMFYASYMIYAQTTMAETCLTLLFLLTAYMMKSHLSRPSWKKTLILCILTVWLYTVHMRTIGIAAVCFLMITAGLLREEAGKKKKAAQLILVIVFFAALCAGAELYKENYKDSLTVGGIVYSNVVNDYAGQAGKIKYFFTLQGVGNFIVSLIGKIFYGLSASFGIFFWGMLAAGQKSSAVLKDLRMHRKPEGEKLFYCFLFLAVSAMLFVGAFAGIHTKRLDGLIYGRYYEFMLPCILYPGIEKMLETKYLKKGTACWIVFQFAAFFIVRNSIVANEIRETAYHSVIGVGYAFYFFGRRVLYIVLAVYLTGCALGAGTAVLMSRIRKTKRYGGLFLLAVLQIAVAGISFVKMIVPANESFRRSIEMTAEIQEGIEEEDRRAAVYHVCNIKEADRLQFFLKEKSVYVVPDEQEFNDAALRYSDFVFVDKITVQEAELFETREELLEAERKKADRQEDMETLSNVYDTVTETTNWFIFYNRTP